MLADPGYAGPAPSTPWWDRIIAVKGNEVEAELVVLIMLSMGRASDLAYDLVPFH